MQGHFEFLDRSALGPHPSSCTLRANVIRRIAPRGHEEQLFEVLNCSGSSLAPLGLKMSAKIAFDVLSRRTYNHGAWCAVTNAQYFEPHTQKVYLFVICTEKLSSADLATTLPFQFCHYE